MEELFTLKDPSYDSGLVYQEFEEESYFEEYSEGEVWFCWADFLKDHPELVE